MQKTIGLITVTALTACAEERPPIDRTQPNAIHKSFFEGEFYTQGTLIRVGYGASQDGLFTSTYAQPVSRIRWVIEEDLLVGRLAYERIAGSDGFGVGPLSEHGQVVVAYAIEKHFDVRHEYNPLTGEKLNIVEENDRDRPWYDREYVRVDFSQNLNTSAYELDTLAQLGVFGGVHYEPLAYYVTDPEHEDAPHFAEGYFDITHKAFATPKLIDLSHLGWGIDSFPACFLPSDFTGGTEPAGNCNPVELTIRQSFRRVEPSDYEPLEWDGRRFQAFGAFTTERKGYDRLYGMSDDKWRRFISRYDIWERSHEEVACFTPATTPFGSDPHRDLDQNGTEDECEPAGAGSRCDELNQKCTIPYALRRERPIVWYYTAGSHPDFFEPTFQAADQWDVAMRSAVMTARYAECMRVENSTEVCAAKHPVWFGQQDDNEDALHLVREVDDCRYGRSHAGRDCNELAQEIGNARGYDSAVVALAQMPEMVVLCHSPVEESDPSACGERGLLVRQGDLRFHQIVVIPTPETPSPWGIYTDSHDPLTGETIAASINVWSHVNDLFSQGVVDKVRYIEGELSTEDITEGKHVKDWVRANMSSGSGVLSRMTREQLDDRLASFSGVTLERFRELSGSLRSNRELAAKISTFSRELEGVRADARATPTTAPLYESRRRHAVGTELEAELATRVMLELSGADELPISESVLKLASPLQGGHPHVARSVSGTRELALAERGACIREAPSPTALTGLADILEEKFGAMDPEQDPAAQAERADRMRRFVAQRAHFSVILHEMGHSIGMRHNFVSSSDALSYRPQYWQLRTKNGADLPECTDLAADGSTCVGPRWFDPITEEERSQLIWMFMQSSTMDYAGELSQDLLGLGAYDFAAARMFYGDAVAVHADPSYAVGTDRGTAMLAKADNFGGIVGFRWSTNGDATQGAIHYSQLQKSFDLISGCSEVDPSSFRPASWDEAAEGAWHPVLDGNLVAVDGRFTRCSTQKVDYVPWSELRPATDEEAGGFSQRGNTIDPDGRTRVPYGFATDRWADLGNLAVYRHDNGADPFELFDFFISEQEVNHIFDNYRRRRHDFSVRRAVTRSLTRYNEKMRDGAKGLALLANIYRDFAVAEGYSFETLWPIIVGSDPSAYNSLSTNVLASGLAFDHFTRMMARPEAGEHFTAANDPVLRASADAPGNPGDTKVVIPNGATGFYADVGIGGRPVENALADDRGEYDSEFTINAGSYYDKVFSTMLLTESVDNFISDSRRDFVDSRYRAVSMADLFPEGYRRWIATNLTGEEQQKGAWVRSLSGEPRVGEDLFPTSPLGWTSWWGDEPSVCFPSEGSTACSADPEMMPVDGQVGWEQQKFLVAWTLLYLPENQQQTWLDMMNVWILGDDTDPGFTNRIELHDPSGRVYVAKTFGKETIFGKEVQRGIAARMLEHANQLLAAAYAADPGPDLDGDGKPDWHLPRLGPDGQPIVLWDPGLSGLGTRFGCGPTGNFDCTCSENRACVELSRYVSVPAFMRTALRDLGLADPSLKGLF
jgi:hypothetical protein